MVIGELATRAATACAARAIQLLRAHPHPVRTITADYGTGTGYRQIAAAKGTTFPLLCLAAGD